MKGNQILTREDLASRFEEWASVIRAGKPIRASGRSVHVPERIQVGTELESKSGHVELEIEISWPASAIDAAPLVGILTGSPNDLDVVRGAHDTLVSLGISCELRVLSAHRTPDLTIEYVRTAQERGLEVLIACAGMANHLAGTVAAHSPLPVIGVPLASGRLGGMDSLLSTVQMPPGVPVATVAVDGAKNAAILAARILALKYPEIGARLREAAAIERLRYDGARTQAEAQMATGTAVASPPTPKRKGASTNKPGRSRRKPSR